MRKFLFYSGIFSVFFFFQCKNTETFTKSGKATLDGKVTNAVAPSISIDIQGENIDIPLSQDGSFKIDLEIPGAGIYKIGTGNQGVVLPVYLLPGEKTTLSCDGSNMIMTAKFEGQTKHENNFLVAKMFNEPNLIQIDQTTFFTLPEVDFLKQVEEVKSKLIEFKKEYQKQKFGVDGELFKKRQELVKPIQDKVYQAVQEVANVSGLDIVFDKSSGLTMLYSNAKYNKSDAVLKKLGYTPGESK